MGTDESRKLAWDFAYLAGTSYLTQLCALILGLFTKRILGPENLGIWSLLLIIISYVNCLNFGIFDAAWKELAFSHGKNDIETEQDIKNNMFTSTRCISLIISVSILIWGGIEFNNNNKIFAIGLVSVAFQIPFIFINSGYTAIYRSLSYFSQLSRISVLSSIIGSIFNLIIVIYFNIIGIFISSLLWVLLNTLLFKIIVGKDKILNYSFSASFQTSTKLILIGIPILLSGIMFTIIRSFDSLMVNKFLSSQALGYYSIGIFLGNFLINIPAQLSTVLFPKYQIEYAGSSENVLGLERLLYMTGIMNCYFILPIVAPFFIISVNPLFNIFLPNFLPAINVTYILIISCLPLVIYHPPLHFMITFNQKRKVIISSLLSICAFSLIILSGLLYSVSLNSIAISAILANIAVISIIWGFALSIVHSIKDTIIIIIKLLFPVGYIAIASLVVCSFIHFRGNSFINIVVNSGLQWVALIIINLPLIIFADKDILILNRLFPGLKKNNL